MYTFFFEIIIKMISYTENKILLESSNKNFLRQFQVNHFSKFLFLIMLNTISKLILKAIHYLIVVNDFNDKMFILSRQATQVNLTTNQQLLVLTILQNAELLWLQAITGTLTNINAVQYLISLSKLTVPPGIVRYVYFFFTDIVSLNMIKSIILKHREKKLVT
jgi:hypothetical protein